MCSHQLENSEYLTYSLPRKSKIVMYFMFFSSPWLFLGFQNPHHAIISWPRRQLVDFLACTSRDVTWMCKKLESFCSNVCLVFSLLTNVFDAQEVSQKKRYLCSWRSFCDALKQNVWSLSCEHCDLWMTDGHWPFQTHNTYCHLQ